MSRNRWRAQRALRVLLACLALWLPARVANASFAPADAVVMIARGAGAAQVDESAANRAIARRTVRPFNVRHGAAPTAGAPLPRREPCAVPPKTTNRAVAPPRYLLHCALLC